MRKFRFTNVSDYCGADNVSACRDYTVRRDDGEGVYFTPNDGIGVLYASYKRIQFLDNQPTGDSKPVSQTEFSFEKFQSGAAVVTRRGDKVEHVAKFEGGNLSHPIVAYLHGRPYLYSEKGENLGSSDLDLLIVKKTKKVWVNLYYFPNLDVLPSGLTKKIYRGVNTGFNQYKTKEAAESGMFIAASNFHLATIEVEVPE